MTGVYLKAMSEGVDRIAWLPQGKVQLPTLSMKSIRAGGQLQSASV